MATSSADFVIKKGDRLPGITCILYDENGIFDLSFASGVVFKMQLTLGGGSVISGNAVIVDAGGGEVRYDWGASDTATVGVYYAEWVVTIGGKERTFPADDQLTVEVEQDVS